MPKAIVLGCAGLTLSAEERRFFTEFDPLGFILFARNCATPEQVNRLTRELRETVGREDAPILIDQEGGRVARLKPPHWPAFPPMKVFGDLARRDRAAAIEACQLNAALIGFELAALGIDVDCAPVLDLPVANAHDVIGDRAFSGNPLLVADLGRAVCEGLKDAGVIAVIKHIPGHGRATVDSHKELPKVESPLADLQRTDFVPFERLADAPWAMVAHVLYEAIDPRHPASTSVPVISDIIRGKLRFDGILIADDIGMQALEGSFAERAAATLAAGNDLTLHCSGVLAEMIELAPAIAEIKPETVSRLARGRAGLGRIDRADVPHLRARLKELMELETTP
jgi:beta-N-acetylhexosaminidase